ncbi:hypothetical protein A2415_05300 [candidate division WWE3 bacterium RIFOXYC1_FULL_39_7]|uniref:Uncharacterized protein n=1 Tax=candidate division WWE3 bacterium RIFOXYC1_FULL_39_7 TaxID=1802643 RepID=A0A1F4WJC5_UNCKA|nr:MAG: hypothetical protein A2415_05300 [candidate division WWE3 bacterium RIFOXYC1_FULL_39_7]
MLHYYRLSYIGDKSMSKNTVVIAVVKFVLNSNGIWVFNGASCLTSNWFSVAQHPDHNDEDSEVTLHMLAQGFHLQSGPTYSEFAIEGDKLIPTKMEMIFIRD